jgi:hypothetical protein
MNKSPALMMGLFLFIQNAFAVLGPGDVVYFEDGMGKKRIAEVYKVSEGEASIRFDMYSDAESNLALDSMLRMSYRAKTVRSRDLKALAPKDKKKKVPWVYSYLARSRQVKVNCETAESIFDLTPIQGDAKAQGKSKVPSQEEMEAAFKSLKYKTTALLTATKRHNLNKTKLRQLFFTMDERSGGRELFLAKNEARDSARMMLETYKELSRAINEFVSKGFKIKSGILEGCAPWFVHFRKDEDPIDDETFVTLSTTGVTNKPAVYPASVESGPRSVNTSVKKELPKVQEESDQSDEESDKENRAPNGGDVMMRDRSVQAK